MPEIQPVVIEVLEFPFNALLIIDNFACIIDLRIQTHLAITKDDFIFSK